MGWRGHRTLQALLIKAARQHQPARLCSPTPHTQGGGCGQRCGRAVSQPCCKLISLFQQALTRRGFSAALKLTNEWFASTYRLPCNARGGEGGAGPTAAQTRAASKASRPPFPAPPHPHPPLHSPRNGTSKSLPSRVSWFRCSAVAAQAPGMVPSSWLSAKRSQFWVGVGGWAGGEGCRRLGGCEWGGVGGAWPAARGQAVCRRRQRQQDGAAAASPRQPPLPGPSGSLPWRPPCGAPWPPASRTRRAGCQSDCSSQPVTRGGWVGGWVGMPRLLAGCAPAGLLDCSGEWVELGTPRPHAGPTPALHTTPPASLSRLPTSPPACLELLQGLHVRDLLGQRAWQGRGRRGGVAWIGARPRAGPLGERSSSVSCKSRPTRPTHPTAQ